jgi:hypothetical protein
MAVGKKNELPAPRNVDRELVAAAGKELVIQAGDLIAPRKGGLPNEELEKRISHRLDLINAYLTDETFLGRLAYTSLKDIAVAEAIQLDKLMALRGQPSIIVGHQNYKKLDELSSALLEEVRKRKLKVTATERKVDIVAQIAEDNDALDTNT